MEKKSYIVRGVDADGREYVYTGRAGAGWIVPHEQRDLAFTYQTREAAQHKALMFNRMTAVHGVRFIAVFN